MGLSFEVNVTLLQGMVITRNLTIGNDGLGLLNFNVTLRGRINDCCLPPPTQPPATPPPTTPPPIPPPTTSPPTTPIPTKPPATAPPATNPPKAVSPNNEKD